MSFHGAAIGVGLALIGFARANRLVLLGVADLVAACEPIGQFFGRLANFINGELWGRPTHVPWGMVFCNHHIAHENGGACPAEVLVPRHPSQLYEAALEGVVLFLVLRLATHRLKWLQRPGAMTGLWLIGYGADPHRAGERPQPRRRHAELPARPDHGDDALDPDDPPGRRADLAGAPQAAAADAGRAAVGMSLKDRLRAEIAAAGPIDVAAFMTRCLHDPIDGYYATRPALGERGDFITAPLVSQMFGELIGLWLVETWRGLGAPARVPAGGSRAGRRDADGGRRCAPPGSIRRSWRGGEALAGRGVARRCASAQAERLADAAPRWVERARRVCRPTRRCCSSPTSCSTACRPGSSSAPRPAGPSGWWGWTIAASWRSACAPPCSRTPRKRRPSAR